MSKHGTCYKMSENEKNKEKNRFKCLKCFKRTKQGSSRIFLSLVTSKISKKIRDHVLNGRSVTDEDLICNKCRHTLTKIIQKGWYNFLYFPSQQQNVSMITIRKTSKCLKCSMVLHEIFLLESCKTTYRCGFIFLK